MVLYTDGLIERRGETIDAGIARLLTTVADIGSHDSGPLEPDAFTAALVDHLVPARTSETTLDDVAIVAVYRD